jgi:hypothetical protein
MQEHIIRFRGGWEWRESPSGTTPGAPRRVTLPLTWPVDVCGPVRLVRPFQSPRIDPLVESLGLRLDDVPGLRSISLNERELIRPDPQATSLWLPLPSDLPPRNHLTLDVEPADSGTQSMPWGTISLVVLRDDKKG